MELRSCFIFCCCGRISMKYITTNTKISGTKGLVRKSCMIGACGQRLKYKEPKAVRPRRADYSHEGSVCNKTAALRAEFTSPNAGRSEHFERSEEMVRVGGL